MTPELTALAAVLLIQIAALSLMAAIANLELGHQVTLGPRDGKMPPVSVRLGRAMRAVQNGFEGLALFAPAVLLVALSGQSGPATSAAAWTYAAARLLYVPAYLFGLSPWRSVIWGVGLAATLTLILPALF